MILLFNIQIGLTEANVDNIANLGGLTVGIIMGFAIAENPNREKRARDEGFFGALVLNLCPTVRCCTFTVFIVFIDIIMFLISIWIYRI